MSRAYTQFKKMYNKNIPITYLYIYEENMSLWCSFKTIMFIKFNINNVKLQKVNIHSIWTKLQYNLLSLIII